MAMAQDNAKGLNEFRHRLSDLSSSLSSLRTDLERNEPLPTWPSLQASAQSLSINLEDLRKAFNSHRQFLKEAHAYPLPHYPGIAQENLLGLLLKKKLEPGAEEWVDAYTTKFSDRKPGLANGETATGGGLDADELKDLWRSAAPANADTIGPMLEFDGAFDDDYTIAERKAGIANVVTGLKRDLRNVDDEDSDDEKDDKMEDVMPDTAEVAGEEEEGVDPTLPPMPLDSILRYTTTGALPNKNAQASR